MDTCFQLNCWVGNILHIKKENVNESDKITEWQIILFLNVFGAFHEKQIDIPPQWPHLLPCDLFWSLKYNKYTLTNKKFQPGAGYFFQSCWPERSHKPLAITTHYHSSQLLFRTEQQTLCLKITHTCVTEYGKKIKLIRRLYLSWLRFFCPQEEIVINCPQMWIQWATIMTDLVRHAHWCTMTWTSWE